VNTWLWKQPVYKAISFVAVILAIVVLAGCTVSPSARNPSVTSVQPTASTGTLSSPEPSTASSPTAAIPGSPSPFPAASISPTFPPKPTPAAIYTPTAVSFKPTAAQKELMLFMLDLINKDRQENSVGGVELNFNAAAQKHAQDMIDNHYQAAHWGTDGLKPYMRYTQEGGLNFDRENSCYVEASNKLDVKQEIQLFEQGMMTDDAASNWSHHDAIISKWQKKVNIGIAYTDNAIALVQDFEGDYLEYYQPPTLTGNDLSLSGRFTLEGVILNNVTITFDELPQPISASDLSNNPNYHHYSLGPQIGLILPPPPPGQVYSSFPTNGVMASEWDSSQPGKFSIKADISPILSRGKGVYTLVLVTIVSGSDHYNMTNYSIFVK
jgi:uncharacterized protein YkwD